MSTVSSCYNPWSEKTGDIVLFCLYSFILSWHTCQESAAVSGLTRLYLTSLVSRIKSGSPRSSPQSSGHAWTGRDQSKYSESISMCKSSCFLRPGTEAWTQHPEPCSEPDPPGFHELWGWAVELRNQLSEANQLHPERRLFACSKLGKLLGVWVSPSLPGLVVSLLSPVHQARRLEAGRNPKPLAWEKQLLPAGPGTTL